VESELADTITDAGAKKAMDEFRANAMSPDAIARAILFALEQPAGVSVSEIIVRPTGGA
jgi:NADP-dependent 3-hydroxy acid dehydrogenase YdfG